MYLHILRKFGYTDIAFVDLYSGAGLSSYERDGVSLVLPGTSLIAASPRTGPQDAGSPPQFDRIISVEGREELVQSAEALLASRGFRPGVNLAQIVGDPTSEADRVSKLLRDRSRGHALLFVDPEHLDFRFEHLRAYLDGYDAMDVLYLHLVSGEARADGFDAVRDGSKDSPSNLGASRERAAEAFESRLVAMGRKVVRMRIYAGSLAPSYFYDLVFATRFTSTGSEYANALAELADRFTRIKGDTVADILRTRRPIRERGRTLVQRRFVP
jgi:hypothetical protein